MTLLSIRILKFEMVLYSTWQTGYKNLQGIDIHLGFISIYIG